MRKKIVIRKKDIILSHRDYAVMAGDYEGRFYKIFYKGRELNDCIGVIRTTIRGVQYAKKKRS